MHWISSGRAAGTLVRGVALAADTAVRYPMLPVAQRAQWLQRRIQDMGPAYVKLGQFVSSRVDVLGEDTVLREALVGLQDTVEPLPWADVKAVVDAHTDAAAFESISHTPLASASIGQVHEARLRNGARVVLKVRRPGIVRQVKRDADAMHLALSVVRLLAVTDDARTAVDAATHLVRDATRSILTETDFVQEVHNLARFSQLQLDGVRVPRVYPRLCSARVIVMEFVPSLKFADVFEPLPRAAAAAATAEAVQARRKLATRLLDAFIRQFLEHGVVHGDPHPGNIAVSALDRDQLVMYDFGSLVTVDARTRGLLKLLVFELMSESVDAVIELLRDMPELVTVPREDDASGDRELRAYIRAYMRYIKTIDVGELRRLAEQKPGAVSGVGAKSQDAALPVTFGPKVFQLVRIFGAVEGICVQLDPGFSYERAFDTYADVFFNDTDFFMLKGAYDFNRTLDSLDM